MCGGPLEIMMAVGSALSTASALGALGGKDAPSTPAPRQSITEGADKAAADASAEGIQQRAARRRALRAQSLLATGAGGDTSNVITGTPSATAGKATLGA